MDQMKIATQNFLEGHVLQKKNANLFAGKRNVYLFLFFADQPEKHCNFKQWIAGAILGLLQTLLLAPCP